MDTIYQNICGIRKNKNRDGEKHIWEEIEDASKDGTTIPLEAFPVKIQEMAKVLVEYENYNQDYLLVSMLSAVATAIGNTCQIKIKGCWTSSPILYIILVGRPGVGKTPPLDFAFKPIRAHDYKLLKKYKEDDEAYSLFMEKERTGSLVIRNRRYQRSPSCKGLSSLILLQRL